MGNEQSAGGTSQATGASGDGVHLVHGSGSAVRAHAADSIDPLLEQSAALPLPHQVLPPPVVPDDVSSALQGAQMMHELRSVLGGLMSGSGSSQFLHSSARAGGLVSYGNGPEEGRGTDNGGGSEAALVEDPSRVETRSDADADAAGRNGGGDSAVEDVTGGVNADLEPIPGIASISDVASASVEDVREEQGRWVRLGIDVNTVEAVVNNMCGGEPMARVLDEQERIFDFIIAVAQRSVRLRRTMDKTEVDAKATTRAVERIERLRVAVADVHDNLEQAVATANILGASHFAHDDEMCSFKNFLKKNPPRVETSREP